MTQPLSFSMYIYLLRNRVNGKSYVGQTRQDFRERWASHHRRSRAPKFAISHAIRKYGWESFDKSLLQVCGSKEELDEAEKLWIIKLKTLSPDGYNVMAGGMTPGCFSEETRRKIGEYNVKYRVHSEESRQLRREKMVGVKNRNAKMDWDKVAELRKKFSEGITRPKLALEYGLTFQAVDNIVKGKTWRVDA